jgi:hypothetical protein
MNGRVALAWVVVLGGSFAGVGFAGRSVLAARDAAQREVAALRATQDQVREIAALRAAIPAWAAKGPPPSGLAQRVSGALAAAGLPATALASLSAENDLAAGPPELRARRRRATLTLAGVTLPRVGALLAAWREREPDWTIAAVELNPEQGKAPPQGGDLPLRAVITLEALYIDDDDGGLSEQGGTGR